MGDDRGRAPLPEEPREEPSEQAGGEANEEVRPSGLPPASSEARRVSVSPGARDRSSAELGDGGAEASDEASLEPLRPPPKSERPPRPSSRPPPHIETPHDRIPHHRLPTGLSDMTTSARLRLELALDEDDDPARRSSRPPPAGAPADRPPGLTQMTPSARLRLELALDQDSIPPPALPARAARSSQSQQIVGRIPFDQDGLEMIRSLSRWVAFCGLLTLTVGALTGLSYLTGPGSVAHVVVGILASALSVWLLAASVSFHRVVTARRQQHHLVNGLGLLRSALLLKAILLFSGMVLGCFTFSIAAFFLLLL